MIIINPFQANFLILYALITPENQRFSSVFREFKMGALARNGFSEVFRFFSNSFLKWRLTYVISHFTVQPEGYIRYIFTLFFKSKKSTFETRKMFLFHLKSSCLFWDIDALVFYDLKFHDVGVKTYILFTCKVCNFMTSASRRTFYLLAKYVILQKENFHKKIIKKCDQVVLFLKNPL